MNVDGLSLPLCVCVHAYMLTCVYAVLFRRHSGRQAAGSVTIELPTIGKHNPHAVVAMQLASA